MKKLVAVFIVLGVATCSFAGVPTVGEGEALKFDTSGFPSDISEKFPLLEAKCNNPQCHTLARTVNAVNEGVSPISGTAFDKKAAKAYGIKMMRRPDSGINKKEAKGVVELLYFLLDEAAK